MDITEAWRRATGAYSDKRIGLYESLIRLPSPGSTARSCRMKLDDYTTKVYSDFKPCFEELEAHLKETTCSPS